MSYFTLLGPSFLICKTQGRNKTHLLGLPRGLNHLDVQQSSRTGLGHHNETFGIILIIIANFTGPRGGESWLLGHYLCHFTTLGQSYGRDDQV